MPNPVLVPDASGEWFEVRAIAALDLDGLQAGTSALQESPVIPAGGDCVHVEVGAYALLARDADSGNNGGLPTVDGIFGFFLTNSSGSLLIGVTGQVLDARTWVETTVGRSIQIDSDGTQCIAPTGTPPYNGVDVGTPRESHFVECP